MASDETELSAALTRVASVVEVSLEALLPPPEGAEARLEDVTDEAIYTRAIYGKDLTPEQASEVVKATQRRVDRRKKEALKQEQFLAQGIISQSEYKLALDDLERANKEFDWASAREKLVEEVAVYAAAELAMLKAMEGRRDM